MSEMLENNVNDEELESVTGGIDEKKPSFRVWALKPIKIRVTASSLHCRYWPNGPIAKSYERGHELVVDGITGDGKWYKLIIWDPRTKGGTCDGYIFKKYTEVV